MFDQIVKTCAGWDWVTPLITFFINARRSPSVLFSIPELSTVYSAWMIARIIRNQGIDVWGVMVIDYEIFFRVREADAERVTAILGL